MPALSKFDAGDRQRRWVRALEAEARALVEDVRLWVERRERGRCRAWVDGYRFHWCREQGSQMHEESGARGMGGRRHGKWTGEPSLSRHVAIWVCDGCHMAHHGVGAWLRIAIEDAERADGVQWIARRSKRMRHYSRVESLMELRRDWSFRAPRPGEGEAEYRRALAEFIRPSDAVEAHAVIIGRPPEHWSTADWLALTDGKKS